MQDDRVLSLVPFYFDVYLSVQIRSTYVRIYLPFIMIWRHLRNKFRELY